MSQFQYECNECNNRVKTYTPVKCKGCGINLCEGCKTKHKFHLCKWCAGEIPNDLMAKRRTAIILMLITPFLLLALPVPMPAFFMLFPYDPQNRMQVLLIFGMITLSFIVYPIIISINKKRMVKVMKARSKVSSVVSVKTTEKISVGGKNSSKVDPYKSLNITDEKNE